MALAAVAATLATSQAAQARDLRVGDRLPALPLREIGGKTISPASYKDRPVWLTFFFSS